MKNKNFIINDKVIYNKNKGTVHNISNPDFIVTLQNPANQCLAILIEKQPEIVHQDYFFYHVWEKNGLPVNVNTFYQSISLVRKALKSVGHEEDIIKTIPRLGISIPEDVDIKVEDDDIKIPEEQPVKEAPKIADEPEPVQYKSSDNAKRVERVVRKKLYIDNKYIYALILSIITFFVCYEAKEHLDNDVFYQYSYYGDYDNCTIYAYNDHQPLEGIISLMDKLKVSCENKSNIYYATLRGSYRYSIIQCDDTSCMSYFYTDARNIIL